MFWDLSLRFTLWYARYAHTKFGHKGWMYQYENGDFSRTKAFQQTPEDILGFVFIGEGICKWQFVDCIIIDHKRSCWMLFWGVSTLATWMAKMDAFLNTTINHPASSCHWIVYEGVFALDTTIFMVNNAISIVFGFALLWVKILKWKMTISRQLERSKRRLKIPRDNNNAVEKYMGVGFELEGLLLLETLD